MELSLIMTVNKIRQDQYKDQTARSLFVFIKLIIGILKKRWLCRLKNLFGNVQITWERDVDAFIFYIFIMSFRYQ